MEQLIRILYALPVYQSAILALLLFASGRREPGHSRQIMGLFLSATFIYFSFNLLYSLKGYDLLVHLYFLILPVILVFIPLFYLYLESITTPGFHFRKGQGWHFLPAAIFLLLNIPYFFTAGQEKYVYITQGFAQPLMTPMIRYFFLVYIIGIYIVCNLQIVWYVFRALQLFQRHKTYIANRFSYTENISLGWIKALIFCFIAFFVVNEFLYIFGLKQHEVARIFYNVSVLGVVLFAGYHGLMQKDLGVEEDQEGVMQIMQSMQTMQGEGEGREEFLVEGLLKSKYSGSSLAPGQKEVLIERLEVLMREEKIYTQLELSIEDVAHKLGTNSKYISQVLNEHYRKNFFTFINTLRVEEAQRLLTAGNARKYSIIGIARMAGFSSKSSFNEAFRRIVGMTPSRYLEKSSEAAK